MHSRLINICVSHDREPRGKSGMKKGSKIGRKQKASCRNLRVVMVREICPSFGLGQTGSLQVFGAATSMATQPGAAGSCSPKHQDCSLVCIALSCTSQVAPLMNFSAHLL